MNVTQHTGFDLHLHTSASDGRYPLDEVLRRCSAGGLDVIAITDHDLGAPVEPGPIEVDGRVLHLLPGAEITGVHEGREFHLLCYFPRGIPQAFHDFCRRQCDERSVRFHTAREALGLQGAPDDAVALTRLHLAHALVDAGVVANRGEAFKKFLSARHGIVQPMQLPFVEAIRVARSHGAITSWAHPPKEAMRRHLDTFAAAGLHGIESLRPMMNSTDRKNARKHARRLGLVLTGGSDWHGWRGQDPGLFRVTPREIGDFVDLLQAA